MTQMVTQAFYDYSINQSTYIHIYKVQYFQAIRFRGAEIRHHRPVGNSGF